MERCLKKLLIEMLCFFHHTNSHLCTYNTPVVIKTHGSESRGQEETDLHDEPVSYFTGSTAVKLVNTLNNPP